MTKTLPKTDVRYWARRIYKHQREGRIDSDWSVRFYRDGRREQFALGTPNKARAAQKALEIYGHLEALGWEATMAKFKRPAEPVQPKNNLTIGEFLAEFQAKAELKPGTFADYAGSLRKIVADIVGITHGRGGSREKRDEWRHRIDGVKLATVTPEKVQKWKLDFVARAGQDPRKIRSAKTSANSFLREAKALFRAELLKGLEGVVLPSPLPFQGVILYPRQSMKYRSTFDAIGIINDAQNELSGQDPEAYKIFLLGIATALRRKEIDTLSWSSFRWNTNQIRIEPTQWYGLKTEDSAADLDVEPEIMAIFRGFHAKAKSDFVIESKVAPRLDVTTWDHYRTTSIAERLIKWLRTKGVNTSNPLHTLRAEAGSQIAATHGIYAASRFLRHTDITVTAAHYLDKRQSVTVGLGHLFAEGARANVVQFQELEPDSRAPEGKPETGR
jgi:integrase